MAVVMALSTFVRTVFFVGRSKTAGSAVCSPRRLSLMLLARVVVASRGRLLLLLWQIFLRLIKDVRRADSNVTGREQSVQCKRSVVLQEESAKERREGVILIFVVKQRCAAASGSGTCATRDQVIAQASRAKHSHGCNPL